MANERRRRLVGLVLAAQLAALVGAPAQAQSADYPASAVTMIVPWAAGGATDVLARAVAQRLSAKWGQSVIVDNRPGNSGMIGAHAVGRAKPDGLTLLFTLSSLIQAPHLYPDQKYEAILDELAPISNVGSNYLMWIVRSDFPAKTLPELVALVHAQPAKYTSFGSYGTGTTGQLMGLIFNKAAQLKLDHVGYRGEPPEIVDLLGGQIPMAIVSGNAAKPQLAAGKIRVLATTGAERSLLTPDVPTFKEFGYSGMELAGWSGMFAPRGTPPAIIEKISADVNQIVKDPELQKQFLEFDIRLAGNTPQVFASEISRQYKLWGKIIQETGVKGD